MQPKTSYGNPCPFGLLNDLKANGNTLLDSMHDVQLEDVEEVVGRAARMIENGEVEPNRIAKTVLVIDEAQDMSDEEYALVHALMTANEEMRVIAVGDDDQNIFEFRGSDSRYMSRLLQESDGRFIEMTENYRSSGQGAPVHPHGRRPFQPHAGG